MASLVGGAAAGRQRVGWLCDDGHLPNLEMIPPSLDPAPTDRDDETDEGSGSATRSYTLGMPDCKPSSSSVSRASSSATSWKEAWGSARNTVRKMT